MKLSEIKAELLQLIGHGFDNRVSKDKLASLIGVDQRTIRNGIASLRKDGVKIVSNAKHKGYFIYEDNPVDFEQAQIFIGETYSRINQLREMIEPIKNGVKDISQMVMELK